MYGERIKEGRESLSISREDLASIMITTPEVVKKWELEEIEPTISELIMIAKLFECSVDWILGLDDDIPDFYDDLDDDEIECEDCEDCENFIACKLYPHMQEFVNTDDAAYIHVQFSVNEDKEDFLLYCGTQLALISAINILLSSLSNESGIDYYDLVSIMATEYTEAHLGSSENE